jgi:hypothetical protein
MWKDTVEKRFFWAAMERELEKLLFELIKAEEEEDAGIYLLMMHYDHAREEDPFTLEEKEKILHELSILIGDTRKHQKLLQGLIEKLEERVQK